MQYKKGDKVEILAGPYRSTKTKKSIGTVISCKKPNSNASFWFVDVQITEKISHKFVDKELKLSGVADEEETPKAGK